MKPRLRVNYGIWSCRLLTKWRDWDTVIGHGYTPRDAYADWAEQGGICAPVKEDEPK